LANNTNKSWANSDVAAKWRMYHKTQLVQGFKIQGYPPCEKSDIKHSSRDEHQSKRHSTYNNHNSNDRYRSNSNGRQNSDYRNQNNNNNNNDNRAANSTKAYEDSLETVKKNRSESPILNLSASITDPTVPEFLTVTVSLPEQMKPPMPQAGAISMRHKPTQTGTVLRTTPEAQSHGVNALALLDSGSLAGNFVNEKMLKKLRGSDLLYSTDTPMRVCSGLDNHCIISHQVIDLKVTFFENNISNSIILTCRLNPTGPVDLIIGRAYITT
jgi:hypothetical protein